ncbi:base excision DNA repair protein, HhH-GPD family [Limosilactobacillus frumenti DSM 13145]|uniref:Base excision DNA repair protein, HhH-GPD family n=1 Tax=Limosilactobacillus frumenti DSM 13145 TaxID=1423746 RepID=A0A0R1P0W7_9LACO|nr:hypothetical protein [Limosilactobacillus frumenti]KRL26142.1 base excision DNA repair protein, HhH-GPD family [Limosilactobacillus frumenti DSM 13145]MBA2913661.1 deoxyribonuclease I [Limosilactobacillus frumenti]QFG72998.1 deoxyribonuclease I [Limosilactobacillus frumenti]
MKLSVWELYQKMFNHMGAVGNWPGENKTEILIGAILVQNTNWTNVDYALDNLRPLTHFDPQKLMAIDNQQLQELIRPAGFYRNKSKAIQTILQWLAPFEFNYDQVAAHYGDDLRTELLALRGIGNETADVLLTFVFDMPRMIADNYARRLFSHLGVPDLHRYQDLARVCHLDHHFTAKEAQQFHGLILEFSKKYLRRNNEHFAESFLAGDTVQL